MRADRAAWRALCAVFVLMASCKHVPSDKEQQGAIIHYDLGVQMQRENVQGALREFQLALELDPNLAEAHHAMGVLLHLSFNRPDEAIAHYQEALELRPGFSEAKTNLANVYLDQSRYDDAIGLYREVLNDMLYPTPYIAHGNLGWALYKRGEADKALDHLKASVTMNPKFCLGFKNLGLIYEEKGSFAEACKYFGKYREVCPEVADAYYREGVCLAKAGQVAAARQSFEGCLAKATSDALREDCQRFKEQLGP